MRSFDTFLIIFSMCAGIGGAVVLLVQFLSLRMRNAGLPPEDRDPHVGRKFALGVFLHLGIMLLLAGLTVSFSETFDGLFSGNKNNSWGGPPTTRAMQMGPDGRWQPVPPPPAAPSTKSWFDEWYTTPQRVSAGLCLSGVMHAVLFAMLLLFVTNARKFPAVSRAFVLNRLLIAGVILMAISTTFCVFLFAEGDMQMGSFGRPIGIAVVWGPTALVHFLWLMFGLGDKKKAAQRVEVERPRDDDRGREGEGRSRREDDDRPPPRRRYD